MSYNPTKAALQYRVHAAARDGMAITIYALLCNKSREEIVEILSTKTTESNQVTTPFIIAARNGHYKVVKTLLSYFPVDIEQTGTVVFDGYQIEGATALWCAAGIGHIKTVEQLLQYKPNVNHPTRTNSTPLRAACFDGCVEMVALLLDNNADLTIANKYNNTCLMIASYKGHESVVRYLLEKGADPNQLAHCGATALHFCSERGHLGVARELLKAGAQMLRNDDGMTPLQMAAEAGVAEIVEFYVGLPSCSREERIEALELLGAAYANDRDIYSIGKCYNYWWLAMHERYEDPENPLEKVLIEPIEAYENRRECVTIQELAAIKDNANALHMEALIVRERILGENNSEIPHHIVFRGAVFADLSRFNRCISLWKRAFRLKQKNNRPVSKDLLRFSQVFSQMIKVGENVEFAQIAEIFTNCITELERDKARIKNASSPEDLEIAHDAHDLNIHTALYFITILSSLKKTREENHQLCCLVYKFVQMKCTLHSKEGSSPLHMICDEDTQIDEFYVVSVVKFPSEELCRLLLQCGADPNAVDAQGNTPLHTITQYNKPISDFLTLHNVMTILIESGTHIDQTNARGETAAEMAATGVAEIILQTKRQLNLKCMAARAVKRHGIRYEGEVPEHLNQFIEQH